MEKKSEQYDGRREIRHNVPGVGRVHAILKPGRYIPGTIAIDHRGERLIARIQTYTTEGEITYRHPKTGEQVTEAIPPHTFVEGIEGEGPKPRPVYEKSEFGRAIKAALQRRGVKKTRFRAGSRPRPHGR
jgi:hypothetical protein